MGNRGFANIELKNGQTVSFTLVEQPDGVYFAGKRMSSLRNWRLAEQKAKEEFRKISEDYKTKGMFKSSYSSLWNEVSTGHNYSYEKKPKIVTPLKNYGTHNYTLGFETHSNIMNQNGKWVYDTTYYAIQWMPTTPITIQIQKATYKAGSSMQERKEERLSKVVNTEDTKAVKEMISKFKQLYTYHKNSRR